MAPARRWRTLAIGVGAAALVLAAANAGLLFWVRVRGGERPEIPPPEVQSPPVAGARAEAPRYRWLDRDAGIAEIPVQRALELLATDGSSPTGTASQSSGEPAGAPR
jgi:hypothetical protein